MLDQITSTLPPFFIETDLPEPNLYELAWRIERENSDIAARVCRGVKMRDLDGMFDEISAVLQFPDYFANNWPGFLECLCDLDWMRYKGFVLIISNAGLCLHNHPHDQKVFLRILSQAALRWSEANSDLEVRGRHASPFHVLLQGVDSSLTQILLALQSLRLEYTRLNEKREP